MDTEKKSEKDYKKCCYRWKVGAFILVLIFLPLIHKSYIFNFLYLTRVKAGNVQIILPDEFFFEKKEEIMNDGLIDKGIVFKSSIAKGSILISDLSNIDYEKKKKEWFSKKNCFVFKKKWRNYDVDLAMFLSPDFKKGDIFSIIIPDLKLMISFEDFDTLQEFMTKAKFLKIKR